MNLTAHTSPMELETPAERFQARLTNLNKEIKMLANELANTIETDTLWRMALTKKIAKREKTKNQMLFGFKFNLEDYKL